MMIKPKIIFTVILFLVISCKKDKTKDTLDNSTNSGRSYFIDTLTKTAGAQNQLCVAISGTLKREVIYLLQKDQGTSYNLFKTDLEANLLFTNKINLGSGSLVDLCGSKVSEDFYTLTATGNFFPATPSYVNAYVNNGGTTDSAACRDKESLSNYQFDAAFNSSVPTKGSNFSELKMFNKAGEEVWTKILDGNFFNGNALETDAAGNVYVLTASYNPKELKPNPNSGLIPYYSCKQDSNSFTLYKFNKDGAEVFKKTIEHASDDAGFNPGMAVSADGIFVKTPYDFFNFHTSGSLLSNAKPYKNVCYNAVKEIIANPLRHQIIVSGHLLFTPTTAEFYFLNLNRGTFKDLTKWPGDLLAMDSQNNFYTTTTALTKISPLGTTLYSKQLHINFNYFSINKFNYAIDAYDNFYCFMVKDGVIVCCKLNDQGVYY